LQTASRRFGGPSATAASRQGREMVPVTRASARVSRQTLISIALIIHNKTVSAKRAWNWGGEEASVSLAEHDR